MSTGKLKSSNKQTKRIKLTNANQTSKRTTIKSTHKTTKEVQLTIANQNLPTKTMIALAMCSYANTNSEPINANAERVSISSLLSCCSLPSFLNSFLSG